MDTLSLVGIIPDGVLGHSIGEIAAAYVDGGLDQRESLLISYWRGRCLHEHKIQGAMAAVGETLCSSKHNTLSQRLVFSRVLQLSVYHSI